MTNELYKGDFVHGKRTKHPQYYEDVVEPIVSKKNGMLVNIRHKGMLDTMKELQLTFLLIN